jgi:hypothetical protein
MEFICRGTADGGLTMGEHIRLADVLLAMHERNRGDDIYVHMNGAIIQFQGASEVWNLRKDDLTEQSDECIKFLSDLLV